MERERLGKTCQVRLNFRMKVKIDAIAKYRGIGISATLRQLIIEEYRDLENMGYVPNEKNLSDESFRKMVGDGPE